MQHPDEGMIHTWLDGQLPPDEAAALEAHVAECPQCAAKVAEERGFAAGATRILTALDNVPADVIPISARPTATRLSRRFMQAAATILVVATGGLIAVRASRDRIEIPSAAKTVATTDTQRLAVATAPQAAVPSVTAPAIAPANAQTREHTTAPVSAVATPPSVSAETRAPRGAGASPVSRSAATQNKSIAPPIAKGTVASARVVLAPAPPPMEKARGNDTVDVDIVMSRDQIRLQNVVTTGVASVEGPKLSVVRSETIEGGRRTFLRTGSGKIAQLTETVAPATEVVVGASTSALRGAIGARGAASSTPVALRSRAAASRTITWKDEATGKFYSLSGEFTERELQEMKAEIESNAQLRK